MGLQAAVTARRDVVHCSWQFWNRTSQAAELAITNSAPRSVPSGSKFTCTISAETNPDKKAGLASSVNLPEKFQFVMAQLIKAMFTPHLHEFRKEVFIFTRWPVLHLLPDRGF